MFYISYYIFIEVSLITEIIFTTPTFTLSPAERLYLPAEPEFRPSTSRLPGFKFWWES